MTETCHYDVALGQILDGLGLTCYNIERLHLERVVLGYGRLALTQGSAATRAIDRARVLQALATAASASLSSPHTVRRLIEHRVRHLASASLTLSEAWRQLTPPPHSLERIVPRLWEEARDWAFYSMAGYVPQEQGGERHE